MRSTSAGSMTRGGAVPVWLALILSGVAGMLVAAQSRINGGLSQELDNGYVAAALSFGSGCVVITIVLLFSERGRRGLSLVRAELSSGRMPWWGLSGGACGAFFVLSQGLVAPQLGLALFTVGIVGGQVLGGLVFDKIGLGPGGKVQPTPLRVIGTVLVILAVLLSVVTDLLAEGHSPALLVLIALPFVGGVGVAFQSALNGVVRAAAQSAVTPTFYNFLIGATILMIAAVISVLMRGMPTTWPSEPWFYLGGVIGTIFIAVAAMLVRTAGVLLLGMSNVAGQLVAAVLFEGMLPLAGGLTIGMVAGAIVALIAVLLAALPSRGSSRDPSRGSFN